MIFGLTPGRVRVPILAGIPMLVLAWAYVVGSVATADGYGQAAVARAAAAAFLVAPVCAAVAAWDAGRRRSAAVRGWAPARGTLALAVDAAGPTVAVGWLVLLVVAARGSAAVATSPGPLIDVSSAALLAVGLAVVAGHALVGNAVGSTVPTVVAVPACFAASYAWMVLPVGLEPLWVRHLTGFTQSCCLVGAELDPGAIAGPAAVAGGLAGAALIVVAPLRSARVLLAIGVLLAGVVLGAASVSGLGPDPVRPRSVGDLVCAGTGPAVCVWPEHGDRLGDVAVAAGSAAGRWRSLGLELPPTVSEAGGPWSFGMSSDATTVDIVLSLAGGLLPQEPPCGYPIVPGTEAIGVDAYLVTWLAYHAGVEEEELSARVPSNVVTDVVAASLTPPLAQVDWFRTGRSSLVDCTVTPVAPPG